MNTSAHPRASRTIGVALADAQFRRFYGPGVYWSREWPTTDHVIPWQVFTDLYAMMFVILAQERLQLIRSVKLGMAGKSADAVIDRELREAYPT